MQLTQLQKDCIKKLADADVRDYDTMLGLLLIEGIRFFYYDNELIQGFETGTARSSHEVITEMVDLLIKEIHNNLN